MTTKKLNSYLIKLFYVLILLLTGILTGYRLKMWIKDYISLSSKFVISSATKNIPSSLKLPTISICNINPVRGSALLSSAYKTGAPQDYELFVDSLNGRMNNDVPAQRLMRPIYQIIDKASHKLKDMLKLCSIGKRSCNHLNFTKSLLPTGACFTFNREITVNDDITLILDPEVHDYIIPNLGYAGFRVLIHSLNDPLWIALPLSTYVGPNFHTYIRINTIEKKYTKHCIMHDQWIPCMHHCFEKSIYKACNCHLMGKNACTFSHIMKCGLNFGNIKEYVIPENCICVKRCNQVNYKFESITQSLKNNIFSIFLPPWSSERNLQVKEKIIQKGTLIQLWAFLREANSTAFDDLRQLSIYLEKLIYFVNELEKNINIFHDKLLNIDKTCVHTTQIPKKNNKIFIAGMEFIKFMKNSPLMKDLAESPLSLIHIHLVNLFFKGIDGQLNEIEKFIQHSDFISALSMFQYPTPDANCGQIVSPANKNLRYGEHSEENMKSKDQTNYLQKLFLLFTWNFKKFKVKCEDNVKYNLNIIQSLSNFSYTKPNNNGYGETIVTLTIQMLVNENVAFKMESVQNLYDPQIVVIDIVMSGLVIAFVLITLLNKCLNMDYKSCNTGNNFNNQREITIQNDLSQKFNQKIWNQYRDNSAHSRDLESPVTTFHLI